MKRILKYLLLLIIIMIFLPYLIPTEFNHEVPDKPFDNSIFFKSSDGVTLHAQVYQNKQSYRGKILFVHGLGASSASFRNNAPFLSAAGYLVISVDLPAFGYSSKASGIDHSQKNRARLIWELLDKFDFDHNLNDAWHLVGHSMGGSTVLAMANENPTQVNSLNLISPAITSNQSMPKWILNTPIGQWMKVLLRYYFINDKQISKLLESASLTPPTNVEIQYYIEPLKIRGTINALLDFTKTSDNFLIYDYTQTDIPIHLFWGKNDTWVSIDTIALIEQKVKMSSIELFDGGHLVHETSSEFNQKLLSKLILP